MVSVRHFGYHFYFSPVQMDNALYLQQLFTKEQICHLTMLKTYLEIGPSILRKADTCVDPYMDHGPGGLPTRHSTGTQVRPAIRAHVHARTPGVLTSTCRLPHPPTH